MLELAYDLTPADFAAFNLHHALTSGAMVSQQRRSRLLGSAAMLLLPFGVAAAATGNLLVGMIGGIVGATLMWFLFPLVWRRSLSGQLRRMSAQSGLGMAGERRLVLDDNGVLETAGGLGLSATWATVRQVDVTDEYVFVYVAPLMALVIPRRIGELAVEGVLNAIRQHRPDVLQSATS